MANDLALIEPLPPLDVRRPDRTPSLPAWVSTRIGCASASLQKDESGTYREVMTLPEGLMLGSSERAVLAPYVNALVKVLERTPETSAEAEAETLVLVTKLMLALPGAKASEAGAEATGEAYSAALDDLPSWAVEAAIRDWYRGAAVATSKIPHDYRWRPAPATLRAIAFAKAAAVRGRALQLQGLLTAQKRIEYTDEHRIEMLGKLTDVVHGFVGEHPAATGQVAG